MADIRPDLTSRYDFDEVSGLIQDKIGAFNATTTTVTTYNPTEGFVSIDGIDDKIIIASGVIDHTGDWTMYLDAKYDDPTVDIGIMAVGTDQRPRIIDAFWSPSRDDFLFDVGEDTGGHSRAFIDDNRRLKASERVIIFIAYDLAAKTFNWVAVSDSGMNLSGVSTVGTSVIVADSILIGSNVSGTSFMEGDLLEFGVQNGVARSIQDMRDTAFAILGGDDLSLNLPTTLSSVY